MPRIEDYAMLGDLHTAILVSREGSIDWCCFPRFDSPACFSALLGTPDHGRWLIAPAEECIESTRRYRGDTMILETEHRTASGVVRVIDFMPIRDHAADIVRIVEGVEGTLAMESELKIRFDYGRVAPWVRRVDHARLAIAGPDALCLRTPAEVRGEDMATRSTFTVTKGSRLPFVLTWFPSHEELPPEIDPEAALEKTERTWTEWAAKTRSEGLRGEMLRRSLLVLKALTYAPTGGIVAAPTTSLPEHLGGVRNWDYRFCWLRDASLTLISMLKAGHNDEALAWRGWLSRAIAGDAPNLQIMYGIAGERRLEEYELEHLPGFANSKPVRIGNAASHQLQLDVFGEVIDALYLAGARGASFPLRFSADAAPAGMVGKRLAPGRRGDLGGARPAASLHALQADGLGGIRPGGEAARGIRGVWPGR
jgi:GH15 family glucan-1,4-alpha-glucosidase